MPFPKTFGNLMRGQEILRVFVRHGFGDLLGRMGLSGYLQPHPPGAGGEMADPQQLLTPPKRFRMALEELGGAFVKLGQLLSTRPDIFPREWIDELVPLQDRVAPVQFDDIRQGLESDLGPVESAFEHIDPTPLAAGSIAQVHQGLTLSHKPVVIKVRRPGIEAIVQQDCGILQILAGLLERHVPESRHYRPIQIVEEFREAVTKEMDFTLEARNLDRFRANFAYNPLVSFPEPHWDQTTERVLTMQKLEGIKISLTDQLHQDGVDTRRIAQILADAVLRQALQHGFFHADPHPGNLMVIDKRGIGFVDCGMVGRLDERARESLILLVAAALRKDTQALTDTLIDMDALPEDLDRAHFRKEAELFLDRYYRLPLKRIHFSSIINEVMELIHRFGITVPSDFVLVGKALINLEGVGRVLDPDFDAVETAEPLIREMVLTKYGPKFIGKKIVEGGYELVRLLRELPGDLRELSKSLRESRLQILVEHRGIQEAFQELDRASRRVSMSILIGSIVLGSAVIVLSGRGPRYMDIPVLALAGFVVGSALALWLILSNVLKR